MSEEAENNNFQRHIRKRNVKLQRKVSLIIVSNLISWVPFIVISLLHAVKVIDANPYYSFFSLLLLPFNSIINPIILNEFITRQLQNAKKRFLQVVVSVRSVKFLHSARVYPDPMPQTVNYNTASDCIRIPPVLMTPLQVGNKQSVETEENREIVTGN